MRKHWIAIIVLALLAAQCPAQTVNTSSGRGAVDGTVTDATGAVLPGATVTVRSASGESQSTVTTSQGKYQIQGLVPGQYTVSITMKGFAEFKTEPLTVTAGESLALDAPLQPSGGKTELNIEGVSQVETQNAEVSGTFTPKELTSLNTDGRVFMSIIATAAGVSNQTGQDEAKVGVVGSAKYSVNGGRTEYNTFEVDGSDILNTDIAASHGHTTLQVYPSIDAIQEMKVLTSNYGAQYGRSASGTTQAITKSGGAQFHGNAYEFLRNEAFNARNEFDLPGKAPLYRRNDFGGTFGGPLFIPHLYNTSKDKTFFFWSEEVRKERSPIEFHQGVPSDAERGWNRVTQSYGNIADFSDVCPVKGPKPDCPGQGIEDPRVPFPDNLMYINPTAQAILQTGLIPLANSKTGCNTTIGSCYVATISPRTSWHEELVHLDHNFSPKWKLSFSAVHDHWEAITSVPQWANQPNSFPTVLNDFIGPGVSGIVHLTTIISPTFLNDLSFGLTWQNITLTDLPGAGVSLDRSPLDSLKLPIGSLFKNGFGGKLPGISIGGNNAAYGGAGFTADTSFMPWSHALTTGTLSDNASKVLGKHTLGFGIQLINARRRELSAANGANTGNVQGVLNFQNVGNATSTNNAFADFLYGGPPAFAYNPSIAGNIQSFQQDNAQSIYKVRYSIVEPYFQDDWHVTPRLVLNLGLRLSLFGNWAPQGRTLYNWVPGAFDPALMAKANLSINSSYGYVQKGPVSTTTADALPFDPGTLNPVLTNGLVQCGTKGVPASCQRSHLFNPAPRIGFAWDPFGRGKTSIRTGYGVFFEHGTGSEANAGSLMGNPPQILSMQEDRPFSYNHINSHLNAGSPVAAEYPLNLVSIPTKTVWPYVQQWSLGVQQELSKDTALTLAYVGSKGTHLAVAMQLNQLPPVSNANNPFGPNEPITNQLCGLNQINIGNITNPFGFFDLSPTDTSRRLYYKDDPAAVLALAAACDGTRASSSHGAISYPLNVIRPYQGLGQILGIKNAAGSVYHSMQFTLRRHHGPLDLSVSYTYSHSIDSASDRYESTFVDSFDLAANRASSSFDQRHLLNLVPVYQLPVQHWIEILMDGLSWDNRSGTHIESQRAREWMTGWELSGITSYQTGTPFSVVNGAGNTGVGQLDNAGLALGQGADSYPDIAPNTTCLDNLVQVQGVKGPLLKEPCQFVAPRGLTQGNAGRNFLNNPNRLNFDAALSKNFRLGSDQRTLQFRAEAFNLFNQVQYVIFDPVKGNTASNTISCYGDASTNYSAGAVGCLAGNGFLHPVEAHRPRTMQFGLKFQF